MTKRYRTVLVVWLWLAADAPAGLTATACVDGCLVPADIELGVVLLAPAP